MRANLEHIDWPSLVREAQAGNRKSLDTLMVCARPRILSYVHRLTLDHHLAEDITHDVLLKTLKSLGSLRSPERFWPWAFQIALNKVRSHFKSTVCRDTVDHLATSGRVYADFDENNRCPSELAADKELLAAVCQALEVLELPVRNIVVLRICESMSYAQIAEITGHSQARLRLAYFRAIRAMKGHLKRNHIAKSALIAGLALFSRSTNHLQAGSTCASTGGGVVPGVWAASHPVAKFGLIAASVGSVVVIFISVMGLHRKAIVPADLADVPVRSELVKEVREIPEDTPSILPQHEVDHVSDPAPTIAMLAKEQAYVAVETQFTTIQAAIDTAKSGDTIIVPNGRYTGSGNRDLDFHGKRLILRSHGGPDRCIIDCEGRGRAFHFRKAQNDKSVIEGFAIRNGKGYDGGAVYCENGGPTIINCIIKQCEAARNGGAISGCTGAIQNCVIQNNTSLQKGGGLHACSGLIVGCHIVHNSAGHQGGGLADCHGTILDCKVTENICRTNMGGGLWNCDGLIDDCTVSGNVAGHKGGGFYGCDGTIRDCVIAWNTTGTCKTGGGGGLYGCHSTIVNCTIAFNCGLGHSEQDQVCECSSDSHNAGGGVFAVAKSPRMINCIVWQNIPDQLGSTGDCDQILITFSSIEGGYSGKGNIDLDPLFVDPMRDFRLTIGSPCIDTGDPNAVFADFEADRDGLPRVMRKFIDMGAYEYLETNGLVAYAGPDQSHHIVESVILDGGMSINLNPGAQLDFMWQQTAGPVVALSDPTTVTTRFTPVNPGEYRFALTVADSHRLSEPDEVIVKVGYNARPVARGGGDQHYSFLPQKVILDGTDSTDPDGDVLTYLWRQVDGDPVQIANAEKSRASFRAQSPGVRKFELVVDDGRGSSIPDVVTVIVGGDSLLYADAGCTRYIDGGSVRLDGTHSHTADGGTPDRFAWRQSDGPYPVRITEPDSHRPLVTGFIQTNTLQVFEFELVVSHGRHDSHPTDVQVMVVPSHGESRIYLENDAFDPDKPTIVYFGSLRDNSMEGGVPWDCPPWEKRANILSCDFRVDTWPHILSPRSYKRCGDLLIAYLSTLAPMYDQPIQLIGAGAGGTPAADVASYLNQTYKDPRYAVNRLTLIDVWGVALFPLAETIEAYLAHPVADETCWVDNYILDMEAPGYHASVLPNTLNVSFTAQHMDFILDWYKNSLTCVDMSQQPDGMVAGAYLSVIGPGVNIWPSHYLEMPTYCFRWQGTSQAGQLSLYDNQTYPAGTL